MAENRKVIDCRQFPTDKPCSIVISGTEDDVLDLAVHHANNATPQHRMRNETTRRAARSTQRNENQQTHKPPKHDKKKPIKQKKKKEKQNHQNNKKNKKETKKGAHKGKSTRPTSTDKK